MELKVWVDGVVRVVCGLSEETSCQEVVIALAQAIGQTGRYVLIQKLRDTERQLIANERPLESLAKLGQLGNDVQFILRRTGPSSEGPDQERTPHFPKHLEPEPTKRKEPKKALTFNLGPSTSPHTRMKHFKKAPTDSPEQRSSPTPPAFHAASGPSKDEVFRQVLQQQGRLQALHSQLEMLEQEVLVQELPPPAPSPTLQQERDFLEEALRRNEAELAHGDYWESEFNTEGRREQGLLRQLDELHSTVEEHNRRLHDLSGQSDRLQQDIQFQVESKRNGMRMEETLGIVRGELDNEQHQGVDLMMSLRETEKALVMAEKVLQTKSQELDELNKELRQCNLQQFIQQTGAPPAHPNLHSDESDLANLSPDGQSDEDSNPSILEFPPRTTAKQILGNPRSLQNPLVSSLHPEDFKRLSTHLTAFHSSPALFSLCTSSVLHTATQRDFLEIMLGSEA